MNIDFLKLKRYGSGNSCQQQKSAAEDSDG